MNKKTEKIFESIDIPEIVLHEHKSILHKQLVSKHGKPLLKGGEESFMKKNIFRIWAVGFVSLALLAAFTITTMLPKTPQAQAQEIVNDAMMRVVKLSEEQRKVLEEKMKADLEGSLEEAKQAKDLTVVPEEEIQRIDRPKEVPGNKDVFIMKPQRVIKDGKVEETKAEFSGKVTAPHGLKVLRYTNPDGAKVILGINEKDEPVMKMMSLQMKDAQGLEKEAKEVHFKMFK